MAWKEIDGVRRCICDFCGEIMGDPVGYAPPDIQAEMDRTGKQHICAKCQMQKTGS